jgi:hypothetical protein
MMLACSSREAMSSKNRFASSWSKGDVSDLVDDDQPVAANLLRPGFEGAGVVGGAEAGDPVAGGIEQDRVSGLGRLDLEPAHMIAK